MTVMDIVARLQKQTQRGVDPRVDEQIVLALGFKFHKTGEIQSPGSELTQAGGGRGSLIIVLKRWRHRRLNPRQMWKSLCLI